MSAEKQLKAITDIMLMLEDLSDDERVEVLETSLMCGLQLHLQARLTTPDTYRAAQARHAAHLHQIARLITSEPTLLDFDLKRINEDLTQAIDAGDEEAITRAFDALKDLKALVEKGGA